VHHAGISLDIGVHVKHVEERQVYEHAVSRRPWPRRCAQDRVFDGQHFELGDPFVDAFAVGFEARPPVVVHLLDNLLGDAPKAVLTHRAIGLDDHRSDERGHFACGVSTRQVHLEEPILCMEEALCNGPVVIV